MTNEIVLKISNSNDDVELCSRENNDISYKALKKKELLDILKDYCIGETTDQKKNIVMLDEQIIGIGDNSILIKQEEHKRIVSLSLYSYKSQVFKISLPNALYILKYRDETNKKKITDIEAYAFKKFKGVKTELFEYPLPNQLSANKICIGTAPREIIDSNYIEALNTVISTPYTHADLYGVNGFTNSLKWFEYLSENEFPYKMLKPLKKKLKDVLK